MMNHDSFPQEIPVWIRKSLAAFLGFFFRRTKEPTLPELIEQYYVANPTIEPRPPLVTQMGKALFWRLGNQLRALPSEEKEFFSIKEPAYSKPMIFSDYGATEPPQEVPEKESVAAWTNKVPDGENIPEEVEAPAENESDYRHEEIE